MPELQTPPDETDPLAHLYKMSRTAGLGSGDYVAVNPVAVTALVFGLAGALVVVDSLFILLPVVGLILGIISWRQVRKSNGTQTGGLMAGLAILLSIGFLGGKAGKEGLESIQQSADKKEISGIIDTLGQNLAAMDPANMSATTDHLNAAYNLFDQAFRSRVMQDRFNLVWLSTRQSPYYGQLKSLHSNGLLKFETDPKSGDLFCTGIAIAEFQRGELPRWSMIFRQLSGKWFIEDMPEVFPTASPQQQQAQSQGTGQR